MKARMRMRGESQGRHRAAGDLSAPVGGLVVALLDMPNAKKSMLYN